MKTTLAIAAVGDVMIDQPPALQNLWPAADLRVGNLEGPITPGGLPADKIVRLRMPTEAASWLKKLGFSAVSLANNHMLDYGQEGLHHTLAALQQQGLGFAGAGSNLQQALHPWSSALDGVRVAMVSLASTVPSGFAATADRGGIAPIRVQVSYAADGAINEEQPGTPPWVHTQTVTQDIELALEAVRATREQCDVLLLQMHWGVPPEWNSPFQGDLAEYQRPLAHALVDAGASVILGHHAHALVGIERYKHTLIFYSLGNFILHYYSGRQGLKPQRPTPVFKPKYTERNRQSVIAHLQFEQSAGWALTQAKLLPLRLNDGGEAQPVDTQGQQAVLQTLRSSDATQGLELELREDGWIALS